MEPPHTIFESTHRLVDSKGDLVPLRADKTPTCSTIDRLAENGSGEDGGDDKDKENVSDEDLTAFFDSGASVLSAYSYSTDKVPAVRTAPATAQSIHSVYTLQSVLMADGVVHTQGLDTDSDGDGDGGDMDNNDSRLPERYPKHSVKAKITWFGQLCLAGVGMFVEALVIITTGQIKTIWHAQYPECWDDESDQHCPNNIQCCGLFPNTPYSFDNVTTTSTQLTCAATLEPPGFCDMDDTYPESLLCSSRATNSVSYSEFAGIMAGMMIFGFACDIIGRKKSGTFTSILMLVGVSGMALFDSDNSTTLFVVFASFFGIFGLGVGGEYPLTASGASQYHAKNTQVALLDDEEQHRRRVLLEAAQTARRGETIALVFAMQGIGAVVGSLLLLILIRSANQSKIDCDSVTSNSTGNNADALAGIWRGFYLIGLLFVAMLLLYRWLILEESTDHLIVQQRKNARKERLGEASTSTYTWKILRFYLPRLIGTGGNWTLQNFSFYGLRLFSGPIFRSINPEGDLIVQNGWLLFNNLCALVGYYCAARVIDIPWIGRKRLQMVSFGICAFLFMVTGAIFDTAEPQTIMFLVFASSFFGNFGANVTTYIMAAETYPTELRATCHGISAFMGKLGALFATILFDKMEIAGIFWTCGGSSALGFFLTFVFSVDLTRVSLAEHDAQLELFLEGRLHVYKGKLNAPEHLSNFEMWIDPMPVYDPSWASKLMEEQKKRKTRPTLPPHPPSHRKTMSSDSKIRRLFTPLLLPNDGGNEDFSSADCHDRSPRGVSPSRSLRRDAQSISSVPEEDESVRAGNRSAKEAV